LACKFIEDLFLLKIRRLQKGTSTPRDHAALTAIHRRVLSRLSKIRDRSAIVVPAGTGELGVPNSSVQIVAPDSQWAEQFRLESAQIRERLSERIRVIDHIGSTAIAGLPAKPIIDIAIGLDPASFERDLQICRVELATFGYRYLGDFGRRGGHLFEKGPRPIRTHAIQIHPTDAPDFANLIRFQQLLRADPALLKEYAATKAVLAAYLPRIRLIYTWYKSHWIGGVLLRDQGPAAWGPWMIAKNQLTAFEIARQKLGARIVGARHPSG
jgi:GrpB-like predicted nucleotidyltransferase (UPF0157 family)